MKREPISNLRILMIVLMEAGAVIALGFIVPFPFSIITGVAAGFFILKYFFRKEEKKQHFE